MTSLNDKFVLDAKRGMFESFYDRHVRVLEVSIFPHQDDLDLVKEAFLAGVMMSGGNGVRDTGDETYFFIIPFHLAPRDKPLDIISSGISRAGRFSRLRR